MTSVDDIRISLRIDEVSNLGKLQKQLEALIGPKGEKKIELGAGVDPGLKRDIIEIKNRMFLLTPTFVGESPALIRIQAAGLLERLRTVPNLIESFADKLGTTEDAIRGYMTLLADIIQGKQPAYFRAGQRMRFVTVLEKYLKEASSKAGLGITALKQIEAPIPEKLRQAQIREAFKEIEGVVTRLEYQIREIRPEQIKKFRYRVVGRAMQVELEKAGIEEERFKHLTDLFLKLRDPTIVFSEAMKKLGLDPEKLYTEKEMKEDPKFKIILYTAIRDSIVRNMPLILSEEWYKFSQTIEDLDFFKGVKSKLGKIDFNVMNFSEILKEFPQLTDKMLGEYIPSLQTYLEFKQNANKDAILTDLERRATEKDLQQIGLLYLTASDEAKAEFEILRKKLEGSGKNVFMAQVGIQELLKLQGKEMDFDKFAQLYLKDSKKDILAVMQQARYVGIKSESGIESLLHSFNVMRDLDKKDSDIYKEIIDAIVDLKKGNSENFDKMISVLEGKKTTKINEPNQEEDASEGL